MRTNYARITVGMPVRNCARSLEVAVRSVLNQTLPDWELLLIDDGSADKTLEVAQSFSDPRIRIFTDGRCKGLAARLNQAIELGSGKYFARMDGDDISYPERFEHQVKYLEMHPDVNLLGCGIMVFGQDGIPLGTREIRESHSEICRTPFSGFYLPHPTWMGRMEWFRTYRYNEKKLRTQDQDLLLRTYQTSRFASLDEILLGYREGALSLRNVLRGRYYFSESLISQFLFHGRPFLALRGVCGQGVKALVDLIAVGTSLNRHILKHRARQVDLHSLQRWSLIWESVQGSREPVASAVHCSK